jgi:hypothetical protein
VDSRHDSIGFDGGIEVEKVVGVHRSVSVIGTGFVSQGGEPRGMATDEHGLTRIGTAARRRRRLWRAR